MVQGTRRSGSTAIRLEENLEEECLNETVNFLIASGTDTDKDNFIKCAKLYSK